jgi:hypothetical protein
MTVNMGVADRVLRAIAGLVLIAYAIPLGFPHTGWNWVGWIGVVPLVTAFVGMCPPYSVLGLSSRPAGTARPEQARYSADISGQYISFSSANTCPAFGSPTR